MITLIHPSRGRPTQARDTMRKWLDNAGCDVEYILSLDDSDRSLHEYLKTTTTTINDNSCVVEATNHAAKLSTGDVLIYLSDDFECFPDWGRAVLKEFEGCNEPRLVKVNDGYQPFDIKVLTIPIMNRALYERLGYFWHPAYRSMFVDEDLHHTVAKLGALHLAPHLLFEHLHPAAGKAPSDETYKRSANNWHQGKAVFATRKAENFPL